MNQLQDIILRSPIGFYIGLGGIVYQTFKYINNTVSESIRMNIAAWILGNAPNPQWVQSIPSILRAIFGDKIFSWIAFRSTLIFTIGFGIIIHLTIFVYQPLIGKFIHYLAIIISFDDNSLPPPPPEILAIFKKLRPFIEAIANALDTRLGALDGWLALTGLLVVYNAPVDFISICKTRLILRYFFRDSGNVSKLTWLLIVDLTLTVTLMRLSADLVATLFPEFWFSTSNLVKDANGNLSFTTEDATLVRVWFHLFIVSFILPFLHSIWIIGTMLVATFTRIIIFISQRIPLVAKYIDEKRIKSEPITLLGEVALALIVIYGGVKQFTQK